MFQHSVCHLHNCFVGGQTVRFDDNGLALAPGRVEQRPKLRARDSLIPEINCRGCATGNADDLLVNLRSKRKTRERHRNGNARLQNKIRAEQQKKNQKESNVDQPQEDKPAEIIFLRPTELHARWNICRFTEPSVQDSIRAPDWAASSCGWKLMMPLMGRLSVNMWTISIPARSMSCIMVLTREERELYATNVGVATTSPAAVVSKLL